MVIILPCAGGSASNYGKYKAYLNDLLIYEYPGHWSRYEEPLGSSVEQVVGSLLERIRNENEKKVDILGHSMGGLIAWKLAQRLTEEGMSVNGLYVAACSPPHVYPEFIEKIRGDEDIKILLKNIRQVPDRVLTSDFFNEELLPVIRNDFILVRDFLDSFCVEKCEPLKFPITCLYGDDDPVIEPDVLSGWKKYTDKTVTCVSFPGDHFFVYDKENVSKIAILLSGSDMQGTFI